MLDGHTADLLVVVARRPGSHGEDGLSFFTVDGNASGLERRKLKTMDETRKLAHLTFQSVEARLLGKEGAGAAAFAKTMQQALICLANEMVGSAERLREDALEYVKMRMQFGRSIASFQTTKNKAADMLVDVELAKSAAYYAAAALDEGDEDMPRWPRSPRPRPPKPACRPPSTRCRCMAASASPGTTTPISGSSAPSRARSCSAMPTSIARR